MDVKRLRAKMIENDTSVEKTAKHIEMSRSTLYRQLANNGEKLTIENCIKIAKYLHFTKDDINEIFFGNKFA